MIELADQVQAPSATGAVQCNCRVVFGSFLSSMLACRMRWLALAHCSLPACPCPPQPRAGQNGQVPNTACDSRDMQYSVPRTNLHTSLSTSLIRLVSLVQVRALLQIQIELDPHPISTSTRLCSTCHRSFRPRFAQVASDMGGFGCDSSCCCFDGTRPTSAPLTLPLGLALTECRHRRLRN